MKSFTISFGGWERCGHPDFQCFFRVKRGELNFPISITLQGVCVMALNLSKEEVKELLPKIGLECILRKIAGGDYPDISTNGFQNILIDSPEQLDSYINKYSKKNCKFQSEETRGLMCNAHPITDELDGMTSRILCQKCLLPDSRTLCSYLVHPQVVGSKSQKKLERLISWAICEKGVDAGNTSKCVPGGNDCWEFVYEPPELIYEVPLDLPDRVADEMDFINLVFKDVCNKRVVKLSQARSVAGLYGDCKSEEDFMHKVAVISDIISNTSVKSFLSKERISDLETNKRTGSINELEAFLSERFPGFEESIVLNLRNIQKIRNSFPIHSRSMNLINSFNELYIEYPPLNWNDAYLKVLFSFWQSFRELRRLMQGRK